MHRRDFLATGGVAAVSPAVQAAQSKPRRKALMKAGTQDRSADADLRVLAAFGVNHICGSLPSRSLDESWSADSLKKYKERVASFGVSLDMLPLPLSSAYITRAENPNIMLGKSPERDREIDGICQMIRNASQAGIPALKYNMSILGVVSTEPTLGRGGTRNRTFVYDQAKQEPPLTEAGRVTAEMSWERITYFLKRVIPVAEEYKVRMACHQHDPGMPAGKGYRGVERVLGSVDGLKRFVSIMPSQYHGLNFCQGTVAELLKDPGKEIYDVIRHFGGQGKIFNVHFRNIKGRFLDFQETFPDEGDVDMIRAMRVYKEVGYDGMIMPDHVPGIEGDQRGSLAFAYCFGYIQALIQLVGSEA
ncbi:MAG TPA: mannonate dehydratase [Bryobacteraceae bacterium]|nr:mannonate dehydratase [Bryobacteraceae bacterium]